MNELNKPIADQPPIPSKIESIHSSLTELVRVIESLENSLHRILIPSSPQESSMEPTTSCDSSPIAIELDDIESMLISCINRIQLIEKRSES